LDNFLIRSPREAHISARQPIRDAREAQLSAKRERYAQMMRMIRIECAGRDNLRIKKVRTIRIRCADVSKNVLCG
jgi:hypothetical protein